MKPLTVNDPTSIRLTGTLTGRPGYICQKLNYNPINLNPDATVITLIQKTPNLEFGFDSVCGQMKVTLVGSIQDAIQELRDWMRCNKIPFEVEGDSTFYIDESEIKISDIETFKRNGFYRKQVENDNSINFIWEMK
jgi:hypothetical protein